MVVITPSPISSADPISTKNMVWSIEADSIFVRTSNLSPDIIVWF